MARISSISPCPDWVIRIRIATRPSSTTDLSGRKQAEPLKRIETIAGNRSHILLVDVQLFLFLSESDCEVLIGF